MQMIESIDLKILLKIYIFSVNIYSLFVFVIFLQKNIGA